MRKALLTCTAACCGLWASSQDSTAFDLQAHYQTHIKKASQPIVIDGLLNDPAWATADSTQGLCMQFPHDDVKATHRSIIKTLFDDNYLYISATLFDSGTHVIQTLKRDTRYFDSDGFGIIIDPLNGHANGFFFGVSPYNVQSEDQLSFSGDLNFSWDNKWYSATKRYADHWTAEIAIPFKTLRYQAGRTEWGINFTRNELTLNELDSWTRIPINLKIVHLNYTGLLIWDEPPPKPGGNISFIPYATGSLTQDKENGIPSTGKLNGGFDAKVAVTPSMNLDLTFNPDFSQIEVDQQVTNLTRYSIFFPEKRTFFLENDDLFSAYGSVPARPFYSRTIGLDSNGNTVPILAGVRLSGNLDKNFRIGIMDMQTGEKDGNPAQNFAAFSVHRKIFARSSIRAYYLDHESFMSDEQEKKAPLNKYGRNAGMEFVFQNKKADWNIWEGYHLSFKPGINDHATFINSGFGYFGRKIQFFTDYCDVGTNYYTDMGLVPRLQNFDAAKDTIRRLGFKQPYSVFDYFIYPKKSKTIISHDFGIENLVFFNPDWSLNDRFNRLRYFINFKNTSYLRFRWDNEDTRLQFPTTFTGATPLPVGRYVYNQYNAEFTTDARKKFILTAGFRVGKLFNGNYQQYTTTIAFRKQPWGNFSVLFEQDVLHFPDPYGKADLFLIAPRIEINFSNSICWTTFLQYNTQLNNFNINSRFQWRFKPMSDIFLVYTDNYFTDPTFKNKNRAIVFKANYWLNL